MTTWIVEQLSTTSSARGTANTNTEEKTGDLLPADLTLAAQEKELDLCTKLGVFTEISRTPIFERTGKQSIGTQRVGVNSWTFDNPDVRMRLIAKKPHAGQVGADTFAGTTSVARTSLVYQHCREHVSKSKTMLDVDCGCRGGVSAGR